MKKSKKRKLEHSGWKVSDTSDFLDLSKEEALISLKQSLVALVKVVRSKKGLTQSKLAELLSSSQSRVAKIENGAGDVSLDLIFRSLLVMDTSRRQIASAILK